MSNNKTLKVFSSTAVAGMIAAAMMSSQAFAAVDAYSVKVGDQVYKYEKAQLEKAFLDSKTGEKSALYEDFTKKLGEAKGFYAFNDTKNGYVDYSSIESKFLEAKGAGQKFDLDGFTESKDAKIVKVETVKKAVVNKEGKVEYVTEGQDNGELKVTKITPLNLKQVKIEFNSAVTDTDKKNDVEDVDNYTLDDKDGDEVKDCIKEVKLDENKKFAILTFKDKTEDHKDNYIIENQERYTLTIDEDVTGKEVKEKLHFEDLQLPKVNGIEVVGIDTVKVKFTEPIKPANLKELTNDENATPILEKDDFDVNNGDLSISKVELVNNNTEANIKLGTDFKNGDKIKVKVKSSVTDYAGLTVVSEEKEAVAKEDKKSPEVIDYKDVESNKVTLVFDKDIKFADTDDNMIDSKHNSVDLEKFYHTNEKNTAKSVKVDGRELTIEFDDDTSLQPGINYIYIKSDVLQSKWEVKNSKISTKVKRDEDNTKPELTRVEQDKDVNNKLKIKFSEKVKCSNTTSDSSARKTGNYTIKDNKGKKWKIEKVEQDGTSEKEFVIYTTKDLDEDLKYELTVENIEDKAGNVIKKVSKDFKVKDNDPVKEKDVTVSIYSPGTSDQKIVVDFDSKMKTDTSKYSIKDLTKYTLISDKDKVFDGKSTISVNDLYKANIKVVKDGKAIEISVPCSHKADKRKDKEYNLSEVGNLSMEIAKVADENDNKTDTSFTIDNSGKHGKFEIVKKGTATIKIDDDDDYKPQVISPDVVYFAFKDKVDFNSDDIKVVAAKTAEEAQKLADNREESDGTKAGILDVSGWKTDNTKDGNTYVKMTLNKKYADKRYDDDDYDHVLTYDGKFALRDAHKAGTGEKLNVYVVVVPNKDGKTKTDNDYDETLQLGVTEVEDKLAPAIIDNDHRANGYKFDNIDNNEDEAVKFSQNGTKAKLVLTFEEEINPATVSNSTFELNKDDFKDGKIDSVEVKGNKITINLKEVKDGDDEVKIGQGFEIVQTAPLEDMNENKVDGLKLQVGDFKELKDEEVVKPEKPEEKPAEKPAEKPEVAEVNRTELNKSVEAAKAVVAEADKYTDESVAKINEALKKADAAKTQAEVDAAKAEVDAVVAAKEVKKAKKPYTIEVNNKVNVPSKTVVTITFDDRNVDLTKFDIKANGEVLNVKPVKGQPGVYFAQVKGQDLTVAQLDEIITVTPKALN